MFKKIGFSVISLFSFLLLVGCAAGSKSVKTQING